MEKNNNSNINEKYLKRIILVLIIFGLLILFSLLILIKLNLMELYVENFTYAYKEMLEFERVVKFKLPYFRMN